MNRYVQARRIRLTGTSLAVTLPPFWLSSKGLKKGSEVNVIVEDDVVKIEPKKLNECDDHAKP